MLIRLKREQELRDGIAAIMGPESGVVHRADEDTVAQELARMYDALEALPNPVDGDVLLGVLTDVAKSCRHAGLVGTNPRILIHFVREAEG